MFRAKFTCSMGALFLVYYLGRELVTAETFTYDGGEYKSTETALFDKGKIVYYSMNSEVCNR
jgi:hypothetical protein